MPRFVVQKHFRDADDWHFDVMLECGKVLLTWQSPAPPDRAEALPCLVRQLPDHRPAFLTYEGPLRRAPGWCEVHDAGTFEWVDPACGLSGSAEGDARNVLRVRLAGRLARGTFRLTREPMSGTDYWRLASE